MRWVLVPSAEFLKVKQLTILVSIYRNDVFYIDLYEGRSLYLHLIKMDSMHVEFQVDKGD